MRVVYVDEETVALPFDSKAAVLRDEGIEVVPVSNVAEVLPTLDRLVGKVDLLVMDIILPPAPLFTADETKGGTRTGVVMLKKVRERFKELPVVVVSVMPRELLLTECQGLDVREFLTKPITGSELAVELRRIMERTGS